MVGSCPVQLFVNGTSIPLSGGSGSSDASVQIQGTKIIIQYPTTQLKVIMDVKIWSQTCHFTVDYILADCRENERIVGVLGSPNGEWRDDWMNRDGIKVDLPIPLNLGTFFEPAFNYVRDNWCISQASDSLFTYEPGTDFATFDKCDHPFPIELTQAVEEADLGSVLRCHGDIGCIIESVALGAEAAAEYLIDPGLVVDLKQTVSADIVLGVGALLGHELEICKASAWGASHILTFDGITFDASVEAELTLLKSTNPESTFEIQARTQAVALEADGDINSAHTAITTAIVVYGDEKKNLPIIQVALAKNDTLLEGAVSIGNCLVQLHVDGVVRDILTGSGRVGGLVQVQGNKIVIEYPDIQLRLDVALNLFKDTCHFSVDYILADCSNDRDLVGLLGSPDKEWINDWVTRTGDIVEVPLSIVDRRFEKAFDFVKNWCITEAMSHFVYEEGTSFDTFNNCTEIYSNQIEDFVDNASQICKEKCVFDGQPDPGCVVDCEVLGTSAADIFLKIKKLTNITTIVDNLTNITTVVDDLTNISLPDPIIAPLEPFHPPNSGSLGDPHCKYTIGTRAQEPRSPVRCLISVLCIASTLPPQSKLGRTSTTNTTVQIRTKLVRFWSYIKSVGIRIGDDVIEIEGSADPDVELHYWINFQYEGTNADYDGAATIGGFPLRMRKAGNSAKSLKTIVEIDLGSKFPGHVIEISAWNEFIKVNFKNGSAAAFGNTVLPAEDMLFHTAEQPQFPTRCIEPEDPHGERRRRLEESSITEEEAEKACTVIKDPLDRKDCIYDVLATQDLGMTGAY
eukprot:scaffold22562_cov153-Cylindrotheca_fusiformis.AAC.1